MNLQVCDELVRDNVEDIIRSKGLVPIIEAIDNQNYQSELANKLLSVAEDYESTKDEAKIADMLEIISTLIEMKIVDYDTIISIKDSKKSVKGGFSRMKKLKGIIDEQNIKLEG